MEGLSAKGREGVARSRREVRRLGLEAGGVDLIAEQGMADMGQMDPDLVGAAGLQLAGEEARDRPRRPARMAGRQPAGVALQHLPMGDRLAAALAYRLLVA